MASCWPAGPAPARSAARCSLPSGRHDGKKEIIDFRLAQSERAAEWERFLGDLIRRGVVGDGLEMISVDGGAGLLAAPSTAYPDVPVQRCWAHKIRNILNKVRVGDRSA